jgi:hypothetical protein
MMPKREDIVAIASSNIGVWELFPQDVILDQKSVFGIENDSYEDRSWGEFVRKAVREGDLDTFKAYAATGVTRVLSFKKIKEIYGKPNIEFVHGNVLVALNDSNREEVVKGRVRRYISPEESIVHLLKSQGHQAEMISLVTKTLRYVLCVAGKTRSNTYLAKKKRRNHYDCAS